MFLYVKILCHFFIGGKVMFKKTFLLSTAALLLCFFTSCSLINSPADSGSVKLTIPARSITGLPESEYQGLMIDVSLKGDYSLSQTFPATSDAAANFENLKIGSKVFIEANVYFNEPEINEKYILYTGNSDTFTVTAGVQEVTVVLKKIYSVIFESDDDFYEEVRVISGGTVIEPKAPEKVSEAEDYTYIFAGWYEVVKSDESGKVLSETPFDFTKPIKRDVVLYAKWNTKQLFTVTFDANNGTGDVFDTVKVIDGNKVTAPEKNPVKQDTEFETYLFDCWYTSDGSAFDFDTPITESITLYAHYSVKHIYTVTFDVTGGNETIEEQKIEEGKNATKPEDPTRTKTEAQGFEFAGWFTSEDEGKTLSEKPFDFNTAITGNLTLYAGWAPIPYVTVSFNVNGGTGEYDEKRVLKGQTITRPSTNPKHEADEQHTYSFVNWFVSTDGGKSFADSPFDFSKPITENTVLYAVWTTKEVYTITFNLNGGDGTNFEENVIVGEKLSTIPTDPERNSDEDFDYAFAGWFTSDDEGKTLSTTAFNFDNAISGNITLYAGWTITAYYHVSFDTNGGKETITSQRIKENSKALEPEIVPTKEPAENTSYEFAGWYTLTDDGASLSSTPFDFDTPITKSITLYAKWDAQVTSYIDVEIPLDTVTNEMLITSSRGLEGGIRELTAKEGYDTYTWKWDGVIQTEYTNKNVFITPVAVIGGEYTVTLLVSKTVDGKIKYYSETMRVTREQ